jgi:hypothetical protein
MPDKKAKCDAHGLCWLLDEKLHLDNADKTGLARFVVTNFRTGVRTKIGVVYKTSSRDRGVLIKFCPFCGYSFDEWMQSAISAGVVKGKSAAAKGEVPR